PWIEVPGDWLAAPAMRDNVARAHARGLRLVWRGALARLPDADTARLFDNSLLQLSGSDAAAALQAAASGQRSPLIAGQVYDNVASRALLTQCLGQGALAVAGWPMEDVLYTLRHQPLAPAHEVVQKLLKAIDTDQSIDRLEHILGEDPLLAYRFLNYTNSAALGLRTGVDSLRRGLVMMGYGSLARWLSDQLPYCSTEPDLHPIRSAMVLRARLTEQLLESGAGTELRGEVYLSGLLSQLDELLREPLGTTLRRLPLSERIYNAAVLRTGPYAPSLELACALERDDAGAIRQLCEAHQLELEYVNRALLRVLSELTVERPAGH
ncbi:MAG TPA: HDOD domain-containing protein, partial [Alicycliphilus sp.]|nr:HDOD domain-containing protein [Alicycliphilus sp.]